MAAISFSLTLSLLQASILSSMHLLSRHVPEVTADLERQARIAVFSAMHDRNAWADSESVSGPGSTVLRASAFREDLETLLQALNVKSILDAPCGDFNWLPTFAIDGIRIIGVDIVPQLVAMNRQRNARANVGFLVADMVCDPLPQADLVLCRDGLMHLTNSEALRALENFRRSGAKWLLTNTFVDRDENPDIATGDWRPLNLERAPFSLPPPTRIIDERCPAGNGAFRDKRLGLWPCDVLPLRQRWSGGAGSNRAAGRVANAMAGEC